MMLAIQGRALEMSWERQAPREQALTAAVHVHAVIFHDSVGFCPTTYGYSSWCTRRSSDAAKAHRVVSRQCQRCHPLLQEVKCTPGIARLITCHLHAFLNPREFDMNDHICIALCSSNGSTQFL